MFCAAFFSKKTNLLDFNMRISIQPSLSWFDQSLVISCLKYYVRSADIGCWERPAYSRKVWNVFYFIVIIIFTLCLFIKHYHYFWCGEFSFVCLCVLICLAFSVFVLFIYLFFNFCCCRCCCFYVLFCFCFSIFGLSCSPLRHFHQSFISFSLKQLPVINTVSTFWQVTLVCQGLQVESWEMYLHS